MPNYPVADPHDVSSQCDELVALRVQVDADIFVLIE